MRLGAISGSKILKRESKLGQNSNAGLAPKRACWHSWSADWPKCSARPRNVLIEIKPIFFNFLEIRMCSNSYLISFSLFFKHPTLYKLRGKKKSELRG